MTRGFNNLSDIKKLSSYLICLMDNPALCIQEKKKFIAQGIQKL